MSGDQKEMGASLETVYLNVASRRLSYCEIASPFELRTVWNERI